MCIFGIIGLPLRSLAHPIKSVTCRAGALSDGPYPTLFFAPYQEINAVSHITSDIATLGFEHKFIIN